MNNQDRNIRTLITCFIIALVALVPLRIVESRNLVNENTMVLGEETEVVEEVVEEEIYEEEMVLGEETEVVEEVVEEEIYEEEMVLGEETEVMEEEIELPDAEILE